MNIKLLRMLLVLCMFPLSVPAQLTAYPPDGVYTSFTSFRKGTPDLLKAQMVRSVNSTNEFTIRQWINTDDLLYNVPDSSLHKFNSKDFWGFVENGVLYLALGYKFHKVTLLGQISYFHESYPVVRGNAAPVVTESRSSASYRLLDMETGDLFDYEIETLEELLSRDEKLVEEFRALPSIKAKRKKMYSFIEQYNKAHPLLPLGEL